MKPHIIALKGNEAGRDLIVGDIHGTHELLDSVITQRKMTSKDRLFFVGDLIDRGPNSRKVLDRVMELSEDKKEQQGPKIYVARGNHENMFLKFAKLRLKMEERRKPTDNNKLIQIPEAIKDLIYTEVILKSKLFGKDGDVNGKGLLFQEKYLEPFIQSLPPYYFSNEGSYPYNRQEKLIAATNVIEYFQNSQSLNLQYKGAREQGLLGRIFEVGQEMLQKVEQVPTKGSGPSVGVN